MTFLHKSPEITLRSVAYFVDPQQAEAAPGARVFAAHAAPPYNQRK